MTKWDLEQSLCWGAKLESYAEKRESMSCIWRWSMWIHEEQTLTSKTHILMTSPSLLLSQFWMTLCTQRRQQRGFCYKYGRRSWAPLAPLGLMPRAPPNTLLYTGSLPWLGMVCSNVSSAQRNHFNIMFDLTHIISQMCVCSVRTEK